jgi:hypothetical protein
MSTNREAKADRSTGAAVEAAAVSVPVRGDHAQALNDAALEKVAGGFLHFQFKLVAVKTVS